ncbi:MAG TPA: hypothetical protein PLN21_10495 [Gemmatales bacterium]|nr:hypothetical protein [Gemmatales bacterium]
MSLFASFNGGNPVLGLIILPFFLAGPFVLIVIEVRAFLKSEAQSLPIVALLVLLGVLAGYYSIGTGWTEFNRTMGFTKMHLVASFIGAMACPIVVAWEVYKRGWLSQWTKKTKKKRRRSEDFE